MQRQNTARRTIHLVGHRNSGTVSGSSTAALYCATRSTGRIRRHRHRAAGQRGAHHRARPASQRRRTSISRITAGVARTSRSTRGTRRHRQVATTGIVTGQLRIRRTTLAAHAAIIAGTTRSTGRILRQGQIARGRSGQRIDGIGIASDTTITTAVAPPTGTTSGCAADIHVTTGRGAAHRAQNTRTTGTTRPGYAPAIAAGTAISRAGHTDTRTAPIAAAGIRGAAAARTTTAFAAADIAAVTAIGIIVYIDQAVAARRAGRCAGRITTRTAHTLTRNTTGDIASIACASVVTRQTGHIHPVAVSGRARRGHRNRISTGTATGASTAYATYTTARIRVRLSPTTVVDRRADRCAHGTGRRRTRRRRATAAAAANTVRVHNQTARLGRIRAHILGQ